MAYVYQPQTQQTNTTNVNAPQGDGGQFNVDSFMQPFPYQQQKDELGDFRNRFSGFLESQETPQETRDKFANRYGYEDLKEDYFRTREGAADVMSAMRAVPENVSNRSRETIVTEAQRANIVNKEVANLMDVYQGLASINEQQGARLASIEQNMNEAAKLEMAQQQKMMTPWLQEYQDNNIFQAREYTGWTFANQLELNRLVTNQNAGLTWSNSEAQRAHELSIQELAFNNQLEYLEKQNETALDLWG